MNNKKVVIIGGTNIDYIGIANNDLKDYESNIGSISISFGGVARNICENIARLGLNSIFLTSIFKDQLGLSIINELESLHVIVKYPNNVYSNGGYLAIHGKNKDMRLALCDQTAINSININFLNENRTIIENSTYLVIDTNLSQDSIDFIFSNFSNKIIFVDVISQAKSIKIKKYLKDINYLKCNFEEANFLELDYHSFPNTLIITNKEKDICYNIGSNIYYTSPLFIDKNEICSSTGAGDAFFSGFIYGIINQYSITKAIEIAKKVAYYTLKADSATNKNLSPEIIKQITFKK